MKTIVLALSVSLLAAPAASFATPASGIPNLTDIALDGGGNVIHLNQTGAAYYCQRMGSRLPTLRELALWATQYGEKVSDTSQNGYHQIQGTDSAGQPDMFYYQYSGYETPSGATGQYWYWSSSVVPGASNSAYFLDGYNGIMGVYFSSGSGFFDDFAVRCVLSR